MNSQALNPKVYIKLDSVDIYKDLIFHGNVVDVTVATGKKRDFGLFDYPNVIRNWTYQSHGRSLADFSLFIDIFMDTIDLNLPNIPSLLNQL